MQKKIVYTSVIVFVYWIIALLMESCSPRKEYYNYGKIFMEISEKYYDYDNVFLKNNDTCKSDSLKLEIKYQYLKVASASQTNFNLISKSYASKRPPEFNVLEKLKEFKFYTINDFNDQYTTGSEITNLVRVSIDDSAQNNITLDEYLSLLNGADNKGELSVPNKGFVFTENPQVNAYHQFYLMVFSYNGTVLSDTSVVFYLME